MSYTIEQTNGTPIIVEDEVIDTQQTTIGLIGRNAVGFGQVQNQNFLRLLENFAADTPPDVSTGGTMSIGQLWYDTTEQVLKVYTGTEWTATNTPGSADYAPTVDAIANLGSADNRWHSVYATHGVFDTTSDPTVPDPLNSLALSLTGNVVLNGSNYAITPATDLGYSIGDITNRISTVTSETIQATDTLQVGSFVAISSTTDDSIPAIAPINDVSIGTEAKPFIGMFKNLKVDDVSSSIIPDTDNVYSLGDSTHSFNNVYANTFYEDYNGTPTALSVKYLQKNSTASTNIQGNIVLTNGTRSTPALAWNIPAGAAGYATGAHAQLKLSDSDLIFGAAGSSPYPTSTTSLIRLSAYNGKLNFTSSATGGISLPNNVAYLVRSASNTNEYEAVKLTNTGALAVGSTSVPLILRGNDSTLTYSTSGQTFEVYHEGNQPPGLDVSNLVAKDGDTMSGTLISTAPTFLQSDVTSSDNLISLGDGNVKFTVSDGSSDFNIKAGINQAGATDYHNATGNGAVRIGTDFIGKTGTYTIETSNANVLDQAVTYESRHVFGVNDDHGYFDFGTNASGQYANGRLSTQFDDSSRPVTVMFSYNDNSRILFAVKNASGVNRHAQLYGSTESSAVLTEGEFHADGDIVAFSSDKRLKKNVSPITDAVDKVLSLNGMTFEFNEVAAEAGFVSTGRHAGVFAQDVEEVLPEAVRPAPFDVDEAGESISGENYKTVQYDKLIPLLIEAIKDQQSQIEELQETISTLVTK